MQHRLATDRDLADVFQGIDPRMTAEYAAAERNIREVRKIFRSVIEDRRGHTLLDGGQRLAIIVWQINDGALETGFAAKPLFFDRRYVLPCRQHIRTIQALSGNLPVRSISYAIHPHLARWFAALGFTKGQTIGAATIYELAPLP